MLECLKVSNFKRFAELELELAPLTVLTGSNSSGKSSVIQALDLMFRARSGDSSVPLMTNDGPSLGEALDVLYAGADSTQISLEVAGPTESWSMMLEVPD